MEIEQQVAATLLDKGIKVRVTAPLLFRLFGRQSIGIVIKAPVAGTINRINDLYLSAGLTPDQLIGLDEMDAHLLYKQFGKVLCHVSAMVMLNSYWLGWLFGRLLGRWLYWHLTVPQIITLVNVLIILSSKEGFTSIIRSVAKMKMTAPNLSQKSQGS